MLPTAPLERARGRENVSSKRLAGQDEEENSPVVHVRVEVHSGTDVVDKLETRVTRRVLTASGLARTLTVRENTLVSDSSAVVGLTTETKISARIDGSEEKSDSHRC